MISSGAPIGLLDIVQIVRKRWLIVLGVPIIAAVLTYFLISILPPTVSGTARLALNERPSSALLASANMATSAAGYDVNFQDSSGQITAATTAPSEREAKAALDVAMASFKSAQILEGDRREYAIATRSRLTSELEVLNGALSALTGTPPVANSAEYNPATYADSILPLSGRISDLSRQLLTLDQRLDRPLAVNGEIIYDFSVLGSGARPVLTVAAAFGCAFIILLWLVALEALRRREDEARR